MAASKAANPSGNLEDVVRSSSTSTAASENIAGTSGRREMADLSSEPAMWWKQMWASKKAAEQPSIDYTREAEKVSIVRLGSQYQKLKLKRLCRSRGALLGH